MEEKHLEDYRKNGVNEIETQEKLNIPVVRQRFIERKEKLQRDLEYYRNGLDGGGQFAPIVHSYCKTIPSRLIEIDYILKNVV